MNRKPKQSFKPDNRVLIKEDKSTMPLTRINFILMAAAGLTIIVGFLLMAGGASTFDHFNADIFSTRRIIIGPGIAFLGFIFMGFAIMYSKKNPAPTEKADKSETSDESSDKSEPAKPDTLKI